MSRPTPMSRWRAWLNNIPISDAVNRQMAALLQVILIGFIGILLIAAVINFFLPDQVIPRLAIVTRTSIFILIISIPLFLLRRGLLQASVLIIITILLTLETLVTFITDLRSIAETLTFFTFAILLAGLFAGRTFLIITLLISIGAISLNVMRVSDVALKLDGTIIAGNFILLNGLMALFLDRFGKAFRSALRAAQERESELQKEINNRQQIEIALQQTNARLEILHEIDRSLLTSQALHDLALNALSRIRRLIPCPRASVSLLDLEKREASFLSADFEGKETIPDTPITFEEFGQRVIDTLLENKPWFSDDILQDPQKTELDQRLATEMGIRTWLSLPLMAQGKLIGALNLGRPAGQPFTMEDAEIVHDIANQLAIALQQTHLRDALQKELLERERLIAQLEANNAELERFTYTVSHDLRNPLVTIKGFLGMLDKDLQEQRRDRIQSDFQRIASAADKMDELLSELLELSRIGRIINPPEEVDLGQLTREAIETLNARLRSKHVTVTMAPDLPVIFGDRIRLREVMENLIDNAAKYTNPKNEASILVGVRNRNGEPVFFVQDNGMGIEARYQTKIFSLFEKLDPTSEGTGIGLALVKRIVEVHGGRIWVESEGLGKGSTFCFTLGGQTGR